MKPGGKNMNYHLKKILLLLGDKFKDHILDNGEHYLEVNIGDLATKLGFSDIQEKFKNALAVIPIKAPIDGMKVRIDGRTFVDYGQFDSGIAVPGYVVRESGLPYKSYVPNNSMILNFS
jgi:hypothetical protein